ncbi:filamentous hemagglutinin N-terminal domain-containing protein [Nostoc sp. FACHB-152]|uniref:two-partner secretion domain-containing protein n=1 Tax=unclassified Nostoc TaxID=2593658 RepID=UPI0016850A9B|nr:MULTISPECIES: filamentous hemagglutinin N-terminal domain-containing protein [unclassified Nostoc]MBD2446780.1 filamentous hemagglutinin N-terminal domain-containing protein [Nostoc sp. FACHB-152]MBD2466627.1 filamentous hemagglutinin N-terminal domain-containing protein [Nostoc sp. FACHB-145]
MHWKKPAISSILFMSVVMGTGNTVLAQITPDRTLPSNSIVTPSDQTLVIEGGTQAGNNLFHSFSQFSLPTNNTAYFNNALSIKNIVSRVTGSELSNIDGLIRANGIANLFLLNPNGIIFGPNARLDVGGSFVASTANRINFADGKLFSAKADQTSSLLSVNIPIGLQLNANSHSISNAGSLAVKPGENITLLAGAVSHTGSLTAPGGTVQLLGKQVGLFNNALIDVSSETGGGTVLIGGDFQGKGAVPNALRTYVGKNATIKADALTTGNGGNVVVWADEATGLYGNISARGGQVSGNGGFVEVSGRQHLIFRGDVNTTAPQGITGSLFLDPTNITIANGSGDGTDTFAGSILTAPLSGITDTAPTTIYESQLEGLSGNTNIFLQATNDITLQDLADNTLNLAAGSGKINFTADADADGVGNFVMDDLADTIKTNGRDIAIGGANLTLGNIDTSLVVGGELLAAVDIDRGAPIPPSATNGNASFTFTVPDLGTNISDLDVQFSASHTWDSDLNVALISPQGTELNLFNNIGGSGDNFQDTVFDDIAANSIASSSAPFVGRYRPSGSGGLAVFNGQNPAGTWRLNVTDNYLPLDNGMVYKAGDTTPWGTALGTQLLFRSPVTAVGSGTINLTATNGSINVGQLNASYLPGIGTVQRTGDINLTGNEINLNSTVSGLGNLTLQPSNPNQAIAIGGIDSGSASSLDLTNTEINRLQNGFKSITIGGANSSGAISLTGNVSFVDPVTLRSLDGSGSINTTGFNLTGTDNATISLLANQNITTGNITNPARNITLISNNGSIDTTSGVITAESNLSDSSNKNAIVSLQASQDITTGTIRNAGKKIQITSTNGNINIPGNISTSVLQLFNDPTPYPAGDILINAAGNLHISGVIRANSFKGAGGNIALTSGNTLSIFDGGFVNSVSNQNNSNNISQPGGDISLTAPSIIIGNKSGVVVRTNGAGPGGNLFVNADEVKLLNIGVLASTTSGMGNAGDITINTRRFLAQNTIPASEVKFNTFSEFRTGVSTFVQRFPDTSYDDFRDFILGNRSSLFEKSDFNTGRGGNILINASESVELIGSDRGAFTPTLDFKTVQSGVQLSTGIATGTLANGDSGNLTINTGRLIVKDGAGISTASLSPGSLPKIFPEVIPSFVDNQVIPGIPVLPLLSPEEVSSLRNAVIDIVNDELTNITTAGKAGELTINANQVDLQGLAGLTTATLSNSNAGNLTIDANKITLRDGALITVSTLGAGDAGNLRIQTDQLSIQSGSRVGAGTTNAGFGGTLTVNATDKVEVMGRSADNQVASDLTTVAQEGSTGNAGNLTIDTKQLIIKDGAQITAATSGEGNAGNITVQQADSIFIDNASITSAVNPNAVGQGGNVEIQAKNLSLSNGAQVSAATSSTGDAGSILIQDAESVSLFQSKISSEAIEANSQGGNVTINTQELSVQDSSEVSASYVAGASQDINQPQTNGRAGNLTINATKSVTVNGGSSLSVEASAGGTAGNLTVNTDQFNISNNSAVSVSSPQGQAGNIEIAANSLFLDRGRITAETGLGEQGGANIRLEKLNTLLLRNESLISATANGRANGGNIGINTKFLIVLPSPGAIGNDIIANAEFGNGGKIDVNAQAIFGIGFRQQQTSGNDFTVNSEFGSQGEVQINTLTEPNSTLAELPENVSDSSSLISQNACQHSSDSQFSVTGRGGLPPAPSETLGGDVIWSDTRLTGFPSQVQTARKLGQNQNFIPNVEDKLIINATGWLFNDKGEVTLTAHRPNTSVEGFKPNPGSCSSS